MTIHIIGAGLAGLTCAWELTKSGHRVHVHEARERAGGRILTVYHGSSYEELGGKILNDGGKYTVIRELLTEFSLQIEEEPSVGAQGFWKAGQFHNLKEIFENHPPIDEAAEERVQAIKKSVRNLGDLLDEIYQGYPEIRDFVENRVRGYEACDSHELSSELFDPIWSFYKNTLMRLSAEKKEGGGRKRESIKGGNSGLIEKLTSSLSGRISYNKPLVAISRGTRRSCKLTFADKTSLYASKLVLSIPCSTLRDIEIEEGIMPDDQLKAVREMTYGKASKIVVPVKIGENCLHKLSRTDNRTLSWLNATGDLMTFWYTGPLNVNPATPAAFSSALEKEQQAIEVLYPGILFPGERNVVLYKNPTVTGSVGINWAQEPFSKGCYSTLGAGQEGLARAITLYDQSIRHAFRPIGKQLYFAGEHVATECSGTMEAAAESGKKVALIIARDVN